MTASRYFITCTITDGETGAHCGGSVLMLARPESAVFYVTPFHQPATTHIVTARHDDAPVTMALLERLGLQLPTPTPEVAAD